MITMLARLDKDNNHPQPVSYLLVHTCSVSGLRWLLWLTLRLESEVIGWAADVMIIILARMIIIPSHVETDDDHQRRTVHPVRMHTSLSQMAFGSTIAGRHQLLHLGSEGIGRC